MKNIFKGEKIILRGATKDDINLFIDNNGDYNTELLQKYDIIDFPYSPEQLKGNIDNYLKNKDNDEFLFVIETYDNTPIGMITAFECNKRMGNFKYGLFVNEQFSGKGYAKDAAKVLLNYYFNELRYHKANIYIYEFNTHSVEFHKKLGFVHEGTVRDGVFTEGKYHNLLYYGLIDSEFNNENISK